MIKSKKINDCKIEVVINKKENPKNILGGEIFTLYSNIFLCAKKKSGKTNIIYNILDKCAGKNTKVHIFCSTVYKDNTYKKIFKMLDKKKIEYNSYTHFKEGSENRINSLISELQLDDQVEEKAVEKKEKIVLFNDKVIEVKKKKTKKYKKEMPEHILVLDDMGEMMRDPSIYNILKMNRHFKMKCILSAQHLNNLQPSSILQLDYMLIFKGMNNDKLKRSYELLDLSIDYNYYLKMYYYSTSQPFNFFYIDIRSEVYRKNFNEKLQIE
jgi:hypothetical protein